MYTGVYDNVEIIPLQRKERQKLQPHMFVARFHTDCYKIAIKGLEGKRCKSSTFSILRMLSREQQLAILQKFQSSGWKKHVMKDSASANKSSSVRITTLYAFESALPKLLQRLLVCD